METNDSGIEADRPHIRSDFRTVDLADWNGFHAAGDAGDFHHEGAQTPITKGASTLASGRRSVTPRFKPIPAQGCSIPAPMGSADMPLYPVIHEWDYPRGTNAGNLPMPDWLNGEAL